MNGQKSVGTSVWHNLFIDKAPQPRLAGFGGGNNWVVGGVNVLMIQKNQSSDFRQRN